MMNGMSGCLAAILSMMGVLMPLRAGNLVTASQLSRTVQLRFVHADDAAGPVDVLLNGALIFEQRTFMSITDYGLLPAGTFHIQVVQSGSTMPEKVMLRAAVTLETNAVYTLVFLSGRPSKASLLEDNNTLPADAQTRFRVVNATTGWSNIQWIERLQANAAIAQPNPTPHSIGFRAASPYQQSTAGERSFSWQAQGDVISSTLQTDHIVLLPDTVYSLFIFNDHGHIAIGISVDAQGGRPLLPQTGADFLEQEDVCLTAGSLIC